jgi:LysM repeat protein
MLPVTLPGLGKDEGTFLVTAAADGKRVIYFIAENTRHSIQASDLQAEQQLNALWPMRWATADEILAYREAAPIGAAKTGLLTDPAPAAEEAQPVAEEAQAVAEEAQPVAEAPVAPARSTMPAAVPMPSAAAPMPAAAAPLNREPLAPVAPIAVGEPTIHVLLPGDNLTRLSERYGTTVEAILTTNGIANANRILIGQSLVIPSGGAEPRVEAPTEPAPVAETPADTAEEAITYTVKPGDSAFKIAARFGVDQAALLEANGITNANRVYIGQTLSIPGA